MVLQLTYLENPWLDRLRIEINYRDGSLATQTYKLSTVCVLIGI